MASGFPFYAKNDIHHQPADFEYPVASLQHTHFHHRRVHYCDVQRFVRLPPQGDRFSHQAVFVAFKRSFVKSTVCWVILLVLIIALGYDVLLLIYGAEMELFLCIPVILVGLLVIIVGAYYFPQLALFDNKPMAMVKNCFLLFLLYPIQSIAIVILTLFPWILLLFIPQLFWFLILLWTLIGFTLLGYINTFLLLMIFKKYMPKDEPEAKQDEL